MTSIGDYAFYDCRSLSSIVLPDNLTSIGGKAFYNCSSLSSIVLPANLTSIGYMAFYDCSNLSSIVMPDNLTSIGGEAFYYCSSLSSIVLPAKLTSIGDYAFAGCSSLSLVTVCWDSPLEVNEAVFKGLNLNAVALSVPVNTESLYAASLPWSSFGKITSEKIKEMEINGINYLLFGSTQEAFVIKGNYDYSGDVIIPSVVKYESVDYKVTSICNRAFDGCSSMSSIVLPANLTSIGDYAFAGCSSLSFVTVHWKNPLSIDYRVFYGVDLSSATLYVPTGTESLYGSADVWRDFGVITSEGMEDINAFGVDSFRRQNGGKENMILALKKLGSENKAFPLSHPLFGFVYHSHPSLFERIKALESA